MAQRPLEASFTPSPLRVDAGIETFRWTLWCPRTVTPAERHNPRTSTVSPMLELQGDRILLRGLPLARPSSASRTRIRRSNVHVHEVPGGSRDSADSVLLPWLLEEPDLDPRLRYNLVVEDAEGFCGWAGIDRIEDVGQWAVRLVLLPPLGSLGPRVHATEATRLLLAFAFSVLDRATMWATADPGSIRSPFRVLEKSGLTNRGLTEPVETWRGQRPRILFTIEAARWEALVHVP